MVHRHIPLIYEQINRNFSVFEKDIWKDLEQIEVILQNQTYWGINANLSNMIFDAETLKPVGTVSGRVKLEHYSHWDYIELSCYICNLLSSAYNDFNDDVTTKHRTLYSVVFRDVSNFIISFLLLVLLLYVPNQVFLFRNDKYISYFKQFRKERTNKYLKCYFLSYILALIACSFSFILIELTKDRIEYFANNAG